MIKKLFTIMVNLRIHYNPQLYFPKVDQHKEASSQYTAPKSISPKAKDISI